MYDRDKDKCLDEIGEVETGDEQIKIAVWSYGGGPPKISMARTFLKRDGSEGIRAIGRMTLEELKKVLPFLERAMEWMQSSE
jgi:hypothetical protein